MFYAGIDVAMDKHDCVVLDRNGNVVFEVFTFENSREVLRLLRRFSVLVLRTPRR